MIIDGKQASHGELIELHDELARENIKAEVQGNHSRVISRDAVRGEARMICEVPEDVQ